MGALLALCMTFTFAVPQSAAAQEEEITILYTNDIHSYIDNNSGDEAGWNYAKLAHLKDSYKNVLLVDAGDHIQGTAYGSMDKGEMIMDLMVMAGYDLATVGNHEFDYGMDRAMEVMTGYAVPYVSCNFYHEKEGKRGENVLDSYRIFETGGKKIAFIGVTTPESFTKSTPAYFQDANGNYLYSFCEDETGEAFYAQIQATVDSARAAGADYVIVVGHLGNVGITPRWTSEQVIKNTTGIDAVIDGHSHETYDTTYPNKDGKEIPVTQTGTKLANIGKLTIRTDGTITTEMVSVVPDGGSATYVVQKGDSLSRIARNVLGSSDSWRVIYEANRDKISRPNVIRPGMVLTIPGGSAPNEDGKFVDVATDTFIKNIQAQYNESLKVVLGHTDVALTVNNPETGQRAVRNAETNLGDLCADAFRYQLGTDIGLMNGGGIRADIAPGDITYNDTLSVFPFGNMCCAVEATGQQIKDALEMGASSYPQESGGFLHVSGLTFTIDSSIPSSVQMDEKGNFLGVSGAYRVTDIMVNGEPLDLNKTYTVASHNYMLKSGGDGMSMFNGTNVIQDDVMVDVDALSSYIEEKLGGNVGAEYADPKGQGRITIK